MYKDAPTRLVSTSFASIILSNVYENIYREHADTYRASQYSHRQLTKHDCEPRAFTSLSSKRLATLRPRVHVGRNQTCFRSAYEYSLFIPWQFPLSPWAIGNAAGQHISQ